MTALSLRFDEYGLMGIHVTIKSNESTKVEYAQFFQYSQLWTPGELTKNAIA